jgi:hypothetical protein
LYVFAVFPALFGGVPVEHHTVFDKQKTTGRAGEELCARSLTY